ncbi:hypothetical protein GCM10010174_36270 [Kutzneria viridogrisea]|uniref:PE domain-containing protein n=2 Tax=Kutzneria TaxID=43356 RepID=W5W9E6_9PSEU|nr:hypothetical protein [Kutzneria albida]AHH94819.1 hypothetical protein KALB_1446 [Kutzneria albida DSM 43870]MBA8927837.1 hypothetical protein [Kutzneria viridogrisea]
MAQQGFGDIISGGFAVHPELAQQLKNVITKSIDQLDSQHGKVWEVQQRPPLGTSPAGLTVSGHDYEVLAGPQSFRDYLTGLQRELSALLPALDKAMAAYRAAEEQGTQNLNRAGGR